MTKVNQIKTELDTMNELEHLTDMLEQSAAMSIAKMRGDIMNSRPFFREIWRINGIMKQIVPMNPETVHKHLVVLVGIDWGIPGNLLNLVSQKAKDLQREYVADVIVSGKMVHANFRSDDGPTVYLFSSPQDSSLADIQPIYRIVARYAEVTIVYPRFESLSEQTVSTAYFSSVKKSSATKKATPGSKSAIDATKFMIEPSPQEITNYLNEAVVGLTLHHYFSEAKLAYSAAQMVTMRNGHDNAKQQSKKLQSKFHRARRELVDSKLRELYNSRPTSGRRVS